MADSLQVHLFDDPSVEILPESNGCMCLNHSKNIGFREVPLFPLIHNFCVSREGLGVIFDCFGDLGGTFYDF